MKKAILFLSMAIIAISSYAQPNVKKADSTKAKKDTVAKPKPRVYNPDPNKVFHIVLDLSEQQVFSLLSTSEGTLDDSDFKGKEIKAIKDEALVVRHVINDQVASQKIDDYNKWKADTTLVKAAVLPKAIKKPKDSKPD